MPIYEYMCLKCNEKFSVLQSIHSSEKDTECPKCSSRDVKKALSSFSCVSASGSNTPSSIPTTPAGFSGGG
jgi:putative FmdB family regulatory protein